MEPPETQDLPIQIEVPCGMTTSKSVAWGGRAPELFKPSQEAIRSAVQNCPNRARFRQWLESRVRLAITIEFHLSSQRCHQSDLDSLLADLLNPLVEGAFWP